MMIISLYQEILDYLVDFFDSTDNRIRIIETAFAGDPIINQISFSGDAHRFAYNSVAVIYQYGGKEYIIALLEATKKFADREQKKRAERLIDRIVNDPRDFA